MRRIGGNETHRHILIDVNNLLYRAHYAFVKDREKKGHRPIITRGGMDMSLIQGSMQILTSWLHDIQSPTHIAAFFDGYPKRRMDMFSNYKKREVDPDRPVLHMEKPSDNSFRLQDGKEIHGPVSGFAYVLQLLGCDVYYHPEEEADDLIASFVRRSNGGVNIIMSSDKDFFQLVGDRTVVYRPPSSMAQSKIPRIHDAERVADAMEALYKVRVPPSGIRMFKAMTGDSSDGIIGVPGLRKKVAAPLCHFASVADLYGSGLPGFSNVERDKAIKLTAEITLNHKLVGFYDQLDLDACLFPEAGDFILAAKILREDLSLIDVDLLPFRIGRHTIKPQASVPDWLADI